MSSLGIPETPQVKLVEEWHRGFSERNLELLAKPLHKDFRRYTYPQSIGQAVQTKEEWLERFAGVIKFSTDFESTLHSAIEAPGKVIIHATNGAKNPHGINAVRESIYIIHIVTDDDGSLKIRQLDEFTDSKAYLEISQAFAAAKANK